MAKNLLKGDYTDLLVNDHNQAVVDDVVGAGEKAATQAEIGAGKTTKPANQLIYSDRTLSLSLRAAESKDRAAAHGPGRQKRGHARRRPFFSGECEPILTYRKSESASTCAAAQKKKCSAEQTSALPEGSRLFYEQSPA